MDLALFSPNETSGSIDPSEFQGLRPRSWLSVGRGFSREEVKSSLLSSGVSFVSETVSNLESICLRLSGLKSPVLTTESRIEILKAIFSEPAIATHFKELRKRKRQLGFFEKLDRALQNGRLCFSHEQEEEVLYERLKDRFKIRLLQTEVRQLSRAYEAWLEGAECYDAPRLFRLTLNLLRAKGWPESTHRPEQLYRLGPAHLDSLERALWDEISLHVNVIGWKSAGEKDQAPKVRWERWHTYDDAARSIADSLSKTQDLSRVAVLMADDPSVRRSLTRALSASEIPLSDPRDPTRLKWEEGVKRMLLPIELVARHYERELVVSWIQSEWSRSDWVEEIYRRGVRSGLSSYAGGKLGELHAALSELEKEFAGRKSLKRIREAHLARISCWMETEPGRLVHLELRTFFESLWNSIESDLKLVHQDPKRVERHAPLLFWFEKVVERLSRASPPVVREKARNGLSIYRLEQDPGVRFGNDSLHYSRIYIHGLDPNWLSSAQKGDYWLSASERDYLSGEFQVSSLHTVRSERLACLKKWVEHADEVVIKDAHFGWEGAEREGLAPILREILDDEITAQDKGAHERFRPSYYFDPKSPEWDVQLAPIERETVRASTLDRYSRCAFQALGSNRWKVEDLREPDVELWPHVKGNLLHKAVELLVKKLSRRKSVSIEEILDRAWNEVKPEGLVSSDRMREYIKERLVDVVEKFADREREYLDRSGVDVFQLEDPEALEVDLGRARVRGIPDRVDRHKEGFFVIDYKTGSDLPHGDEILDGYRTQLPFYALALRKKHMEEVIGAQYVELNRSAGRSRGIFLDHYNGKEKGSLTRARANSRSLVSGKAPEEIWKNSEARIRAQLEGFLDGRYPAEPYRETECVRCVFSDLCGFRRRLNLERNPVRISLP